MVPIIYIQYKYFINCSMFLYTFFSQLFFTVIKIENIKDFLTLQKCSFRFNKKII